MKKIEDTKDAVNQRTDNTMAKRKLTNRQTMIYKTLHRTLKIEQKHEPRKNSNASEGLSVPAPLVTPVSELDMKKKFRYAIGIIRYRK